MRLVFAGTPDVAVPSLETLAASHHDVVAVVTRPDAPAGRGRRLTASAIAQAAERLGIEVLKPEHPRDQEFLDRLRALAPDACPVVAYGALVPRAALDIPRHGWINLHFSLLPRWRGAAPVQRAIMAGDTHLGTTCFRLVPELDAGDLYETERIPMPDATAGEVLDQLAHSGAAQLLRVMNAVSDGAHPTPQPAEGVTHAPKLTTDEARVNFERPAQEVRNHIMGCSPQPGAWCLVGSDRLKLLRADVHAEVTHLAPGALQITKRTVLVGTAQGAIGLLEVQPAGKRRIAASDWARGVTVGALA